MKYWRVYDVQIRDRFDGSECLSFHWELLLLKMYAKSLKKLTRIYTNSLRLVGTFYLFISNNTNDWKKPWFLVYFFGTVFLFLNNRPRKTSLCALRCIFTSLRSFGFNYSIEIRYLHDVSHLNSIQNNCYLLFHKVSCRWIFADLAKDENPMFIDLDILKFN